MSNQTNHENKRQKTSPKETIILSRDVRCHILKKLPVKDLLRFKCVSKDSYSLINDPYFIKLHLNESMETTKRNNSFNIILRDATSGKLFVVVGFDYFNLEVPPVHLNHPFKHTLLCNYCEHFSDHTEVMGSCNGLLYLVNESYRTKTMVLWNMSTGDYKVLPDPPVVPRWITRQIFYGFGYDSIADDYKVVRIVQGVDDVNGRVKVYSLKTNTWRCSQGIPNHCYIAHPYSWRRGGTFLCGALHWVVKGKSRENFTRVIAFDIGSEKYHEIELLDNMTRTSLYPDTKNMALGVSGGCLCILSFDVDDRLWKLWVMKDYGVKESWTLFRVVQDMYGTYPPLLHPLAYSKNYGKFMLKSHSFVSDIDPYSSEICIGSLVTRDLDTRNETNASKREKKGFHCSYSKGKLIYHV